MTVNIQITEASQCLQLTNCTKSMTFESKSALLHHIRRCFLAACSKRGETARDKSRQGPVRPSELLKAPHYIMKQSQSGHCDEGGRRRAEGKRSGRGWGRKDIRPQSTYKRKEKEERGLLVLHCGLLYNGLRFPTSGLLSRINNGTLEESSDGNLY